MCAVVIWLLSAMNVVWAQDEAQGEILIFDPAVTFARDRFALSLRVDPAHPSSSDENPGTLRLPLRTIGRAITLAEAANAQGQGVHIQLANAVYRESVELTRKENSTDAPILFEADTPGRAILSGSDVWDNWQFIQTITSTDGAGDVGVYVHEWPHDWGMAAIPQGWLDAGLNVPVPDILRRREMIVINGLPLRQALSDAEAAKYPESFYVEESTDRVFIYTRQPLDNALIEVAIRPIILRIHERSNIGLKGLQFRHASTVYDSAVQIQRSQNLWLEQNTFAWNSSGGLGLNRSTNIVGRRNLYADNGGTGYGGGFNVNLLSEDETANRNNWRGGQGNFIGWSQAGVKHLYVRNATYRRLIVTDNQSHGFWLDSDNVDVLIENAEISRNLNSGLYLEVSRGPVIVRETTIAENAISGIRAANMMNITLQQNRLYDNRFAQIFITGENTGRTITNWDTGEKYVLAPAENWTMLENVVLSNVEDAPLVRLTLSATPWQTFTSSLIASRNVWYDATSEASFRLGDQVMNFAQWQSVTGQDLTSTFGQVEN